MVSTPGPDTCLGWAALTDQAPLRDGSHLQGPRDALLKCRILVSALYYPRAFSTVKYPTSCEGLLLEPREYNTWLCNKYVSRRTLVGYCPGGHRESAMTERLHSHFTYT